MAIDGSITKIMTQTYNEINTEMFVGTENLCSAMTITVYSFELI